MNFFSFKKIFLLFILIFIPILQINASETEGTIDATDKTALLCHNATCSTNSRINFKTTNGTAVTITDTAITGMVWAENYGWIKLNPSNGGVTNTEEGELGGYAWGENTGWINFAPTNGGVSITDDGEFDGYAWSQNTGWIKFDCNTANACVKTDWRPASVRDPGSGGGGDPDPGGGGSGGSSSGSVSGSVGNLYIPPIIPVLPPAIIPTPTPVPVPTPIQKPSLPLVPAKPVPKSDSILESSNASNIIQEPLNNNVGQEIQKVPDKNISEVKSVSDFFEFVNVKKSRWVTTVDNAFIATSNSSKTFFEKVVNFSEKTFVATKNTTLKVVNVIPQYLDIVVNTTLTFFQKIIISISNIFS